MKKSTRDEYQRRVLRVQEHLAERLAEQIEPAELAAVAGFSLHHFHRVFRGMTGESVMDFARRLRLERAARFLRSSDRPVMDIALDAGYGSHEAFTRAFTSAFGIAPSDYRRTPGEAVARARSVSTQSRSKVEIRELPERRVIYMRDTGPYSEVGQLWQRLMAWLGQGGVPLSVGEDGQPPVMYGRVHDDPDVTPADKLRYDACLEVAAEPDDVFELPPGPVALGRLVGGRHAVVVHRGPYSTLPETYLDLVGRWFPRSGYVPAAVPFLERYLNLPQDTAPEDLLTEVCMLIEERGWMT